MKRALSWLTAMCSSLLPGASLTAGPPLKAARSPYQAVQPVGVSVSSPAPAVGDGEQALAPLLQRLSVLNDLIGRDVQSPQAWRHHLEQAEILIQLAGKEKPPERDDWLRMAASSLCTAAVLSPDGEQSALQRLRQLPSLIACAFPGSAAVSYTALQGVRADHLLAVNKDGDVSATQEHLAAHLLQFAHDYPRSPEAPEVTLEAAQIYASVQKLEDARRCYRDLIQTFPEHALARKAGGALWRMGPSTEPLRLELSLLFPTSESGGQPLDLRELSGKIVVVYFWSSATAQTAEDFQTLKRLTDRYPSRDLEVVYVNLDADPATGRAFLSGRLTAGVHIYQPGGFDGAVVARY